MLSHLNSLTHRFPRFPPRNLCSIVMPTVCFLAYSYYSSIISRIHSFLFSDWKPSEEFVVQRCARCVLSCLTPIILLLSLLLLLLLLLVTRPLLRDEAWRKNMEPQKPGNSRASGPEAVEKQKVAKE